MILEGSERLERNVSLGLLARVFSPSAADGVIASTGNGEPALALVVVPADGHVMALTWFVSVANEEIMRSQLLAASNG